MAASTVLCLAGCPRTPPRELLTSVASEAVHEKDFWYTSWHLEAKKTQMRVHIMDFRGKYFGRKSAKNLNPRKYGTEK